MAEKALLDQLLELGYEQDYARTVISHVDVTNQQALEQCFVWMEV